MRLRPVLFILAIASGGSLQAADWVSVSGSQARKAEIDRASILQSDPGTKVAWGRIVLPDDEADKAGYKVIKAIKPGMIKEAVTKLLPEFAEALEPMYDKAGRDGDAFSKYLIGHQDEAADALLGVTDRKAHNAKNQTLKKTYDRLRGGAKTHVSAAVPNLARTLGRYA